jgi:hypothetical protein
MKRLGWLFAVVILAGSASGQTVTGPGAHPTVTVSAVTWQSNQVLQRTVTVKGNYGTTTRTEGVTVRTMSATVTNTGSLPIESIRLVFVLSDPDTGEVWFRYKAHNKKKLLPGESRLIVKAVTPTLGHVPRDQIAVKSATITEVKYSDGSVWRQQ